METIKNFIAGLLVVIFALIVSVFGFLLWPLMLGIGSLILFFAVIVLAIVVGVYIIVLIGHVVRKGLSGTQTETKGKG